MKKGIIAGIVFSFLLPLAVLAQSTTPSVAELQAKIQTLLAQIAEMKAHMSLQGTAVAKPCVSFDQDLRLGDHGDAVAALQKALAQAGFSTGSDGTGTFGEGTASGVVGFQEKYASDILTPNGLSYGTGFVGKSTRTLLRKLFGCSASSPASATLPIDATTNSGTTVTVPVHPTTTTAPAAPTATLLINSEHSKTLAVGETDHYTWSSTNADSFYSYSVANNPTQCGQGMWVANTASGSSDTTIVSQWAGCVWKVTYVVKNSATGQYANDAVTLRVAPSPTSTTPVASPSPSALIASPSTGAAPLSVKFITYTHGDSAVPASIDFGDGSTGALTQYACTSSYPAICYYSATHTYDGPGNYTAVVSDPSNNALSKTTVAVIYPATTNGVSASASPQ